MSRGAVTCDGDITAPLAALLPQLEWESHEDHMGFPTEPCIVPGSSLHLDFQAVYAHSAISHECNLRQIQLSS